MFSALIDNFKWRALFPFHSTHTYFDPPAEMTLGRWGKLQPGDIVRSGYGDNATDRVIVGVRKALSDGRLSDGRTVEIDLPRAISRGSSIVSYSTDSRHRFRLVAKCH